MQWSHATIAVLLGLSALSSCARVLTFLNPEQTRTHLPAVAHAVHTHDPLHQRLHLQHHHKTTTHAHTQHTQLETFSFFSTCWDAFIHVPLLSFITAAAWRGRIASVRATGLFWLGSVSSALAVVLLLEPTDWGRASVWLVTPVFVAMRVLVPVVLGVFVCWHRSEAGMIHHSVAAHAAENPAALRVFARKRSFWQAVASLFARRRDLVLLLACLLAVLLHLARAWCAHIMLGHDAEEMTPAVLLHAHGDFVAKWVQFEPLLRVSPIARTQALVLSAVSVPALLSVSLALLWPAHKVWMLDLCTFYMGFCLQGRVIEVLLPGFDDSTQPSLLWVMHGTMFFVLPLMLWFRCAHEDQRFFALGPGGWQQASMYLPRRKTSPPSVLFPYSEAVAQGSDSSSPSDGSPHAVSLRRRRGRSGRPPQRDGQPLPSHSAVFGAATATLRSEATRKPDAKKSRKRGRRRKRS